MKRYEVTIDGNKAAVTGRAVDVVLDSYDVGNETVSRYVAVSLACKKIYGAKVTALCDEFDDFLNTEAEVFYDIDRTKPAKYINKRAKVSIRYV